MKSTASLSFVFLVLALGVLAPAFAAEPARCEAAAPNDSEPWIHNARILSAYPPASPLPRFLGAFGNSAKTFELQLWQDRDGVFGQLLHPVLDADSPSSVLHQASWNPKTGQARFTALFPQAVIRFKGALTQKAFRGTASREGRTQAIDLRKLRPAEAHGAPDRSQYRSRAQFNCAMALFHRYQENAGTQGGEPDKPAHHN